MKTNSKHLRLRCYSSVCCTLVCVFHFSAVTVEAFSKDKGESLTIQADHQPGADACERINSAERELRSAGGTIDARGFRGPLTCGSSISLTKPTRLVFGSLNITSAADPIINVASANVSISGSGPRQTLLKETVRNANVIDVVPGVSHIKISDIGMTAAGKTIDEVHFNQGNCLFAGAGNGSDPPSQMIVDVLVSRISCQDGQNGVVFRYVERSRVENSTFHFGNAGLAQILLVTSKDNIIRKNSLVDSGRTANAIYLRPITTDPNDASNNNTISNNDISGTYSFEAINIAGAYNVADENQIAISSATTNTTGIALFQPGRASIGDTTSETHDNSVTKNNIGIDGPGGSGCFGILVTDNGSVGPLGANNNKIVQNNVKVNCHGLAIIRAGSRNVVSNNTINVIGGNSRDGIVVSPTSSSDNVLTGNRIIGFTGNGINVQGRRTSVSQNEVTGGTASAGAAVFIASSAAEAVIEENSLHHNAGRGISVQSGGGKAIVVRNNKGESNALPDAIDRSRVEEPRRNN